MALSKTMTLTDEFGVDVQLDDLYVKVATVTANKSTAEVLVTLHRSQDAPALQGWKRSFQVDLEGPNHIKQAYQFLKTLPEFSDAVDC